MVRRRTARQSLDRFSYRYYISTAIARSFFSDPRHSMAADNIKPTIFQNIHAAKAAKPNSTSITRRAQQQRRLLGTDIMDDIIAVRCVVDIAVE